MARTKAAATVSAAPTAPAAPTRTTRSQAAGTAPRTPAAPAAPSNPPRTTRTQTAGKAPRTTPAPAARPAARPAPAPAPAEEDDEFISEATYQRAEAQPKLLVTIPMADGRVKIFGGKYSGQTMYDEATGKKYKPGVGSTAYYVKQAENAARKAEKAPERVKVAPDIDQPLVNLKMVTSNYRVTNDAFRTPRATPAHNRDDLATVGRVYGQDADLAPDGMGRRDYAPPPAPGSRDTFTRYGRRPRVLPRYGHVRAGGAAALESLDPNQPPPAATIKAARISLDEAGPRKRRRQAVAAAAR